MNNFNVFILKFVISVPFTHWHKKRKQLSSHKIGKQKNSSVAKNIHFLQR